MITSQQQAKFWAGFKPSSLRLKLAKLADEKGLRSPDCRCRKYC
jgi:hypothetical protein